VDVETSAAEAASDTVSATLDTAVFDIDFLTVMCTVPEVEVVDVLAAVDSLLSVEATETAAEVESFLLAAVLDVLSAG